MGNMMELDRSYVAGTYKRFPVEVVSGKGSKLYDEQGKCYIDMGSGIGVTAFGIADERWQQAVTAQLSLVQHTSNLYYTAPCARLAQMLCQRTGMSKVFFSNSGAEANECAIKVARKYAAQKKGGQHYTIVTLENSFHGRTLTTLAATGQEHFHQLFQPLTPGFVSVPANDFAALKQAALELADLTDIPQPKAVDGYTFTWDRKDFTSITEDITVTAQKTLLTYKIEYVLNGGTNNASNVRHDVRRLVHFARFLPR